MHITKHNSSSPKHWLIYLLFAAILGPLFWFLAIYPLVPKTTTGWILGTFAGAVVGIYGVISALLISWLQQQVRYRLICRAIAAVVAVSLGISIFWFALKGQAFVVANFSYFGH